MLGAHTWGYDSVNVPKALSTKFKGLRLAGPFPAESKSSASLAQ